MTIGGSLTLYAWRAPKLYVPGGFELFSREFFLLVNNVILVSVAGLVLWGTLVAPRLRDAGIGKISVGPPVFAVMFLVPMLPLMAFLAIGMHSVWRRGKLTMTRAPDLVDARRRRVLLALVAAGLGFGIVPLGGSRGHELRLLDHFSALLEPVRRLRQGQKLHCRRCSACRSRISASACSPSARAAWRATRSKRTWRSSPAAASASRATIFASSRPSDVRGPNYDAVEAAGRGHPRRQARHDSRAAEAALLGAADRQQPGGDLGELVARPVRRHGQPAGRRRLEHAHSVQAAGALHLAGRARHGAGRHRRGDRSALSAQGDNAAATRAGTAPDRSRASGGA